MGLPDQTSSSPHLYPQALQLKLYQAFIFSIPILFSIILFLLFYLFYLKRRATTNNPSLSSPPVIARFSRRATQYLPSMGLKGEIKDKLPIVLFDEELGRKDSQCCVCLGEFELKEELLQMPSCKHVFHVECIHHWLHSNSTCPLCRSSISAAAVVSRVQPPPQDQPAAVPALLQEPPRSSDRAVSSANDCTREHSVIIHVPDEGP